MTDLPWEELRPFTDDELRRIAAGETSLYEAVPYRDPTLEEYPIRSRQGKWGRGLPTSARKLPEWTDSAVTSSPSQRYLWPDGPGMLLWIDGDSHLVIDDACAALVELRRETEELTTLVLDREHAPADRGVMVWAEPFTMGGTTQAPSRIAIMWQFGRNKDGSPTAAVDVYADTPGAGVWRWSMPVRPGMEPFNIVAIPNHVCVDPGDGCRRSLDPRSELSDTIKRVIAMAAGAMVTTWALLDQGGIIETVTTTAEESRNKSVRRRARHRREPDVELVRIRRTQREVVDAMGNAPEATEEEKARERDFRWVVSGHWRSQPHGPARSLRRPIFVAAHLKGPEGAPIRRPRRRVYVL